MSSGASVPPPEKCVIGPLLHKWAAQKPHEEAFIFENGPTWTWAQMLQKTVAAAGALRTLGVGPGNHVLSWQPNSPAAIITWFALNYLGAIFVPMNTAYKGRILQNLVQLSDAELLICHADFVKQINDIDIGSQLTDIVVVGGDAKADRLKNHDEDELFGDKRGCDIPAHEVQPWDPMYIIFTSGTTGPSKAVLSSYVQTYTTGAEAFDFVEPSDRILINLPFFHVSGTVLAAMTVAIGCSCVIATGFSTDQFWPVIRRHKITMACLLSAMVPFLLKLPKSDNDYDHPLRHVITVPWNSDAMALAERHNLQMRTSFNMTETCTPLMSGPNPEVVGTCGSPRPGIEVRVVDEHDIVVPPGQVGELIIRTDRPWSMNSGYYKNPEATAKAWRNGWFHTGDAFKYDEHNNFFYVDRLKDSIRRRGENISSFEIESEVSMFHAVADVAAIPVPSEHSEDEVMIVVAPVKDKTIDHLELFRFLEANMAHFMLPSYIRVMPELPKTPTQKIRKDRLRAEGITADTWYRGNHGINVRRKN